MADPSASKISSASPSTSARATSSSSWPRIDDPRATAATYKVTPALADAFNRALRLVIESKLGEKVTLDNLYIGFRGQAAESESAIRQALAELRLEGRPNHADALQFAESCARGRISKFQPCRPDRLEAEYLAEVLTSDTEARAALPLQGSG